ncbi:MAG: L-aspartate oxidase [Acidobacteriota bacterium]|nr:L-aspartate oxidase [Acidobacteriota bacterium]
MIGFGAGVLAPQIDPEGCERLSCDVLIVGCGVAGLYAALGLPESLSVEMLCKEDVASCDSMLAQGGICVQRDDDDYDPWFEDTLRAGHYENRRESVDIMIRESRALIDDLMSLGVTFDRTPTGELDYTREGAHSRPRILHAADLTGAEITTKLREAVERRSNIGIHEYTTMRDLLVEEGRCVGVLATDGANEPLMALARDTVLATGGVGGLYPRSTNFRSLTGDGCRICQQAGVELEHMDYVQIHPTSLYTPNPDRAFLISESCRGEGAVLLDASGRRFTDELQPRDVVTEAIYRQMERDRAPHVWLSFEGVPKRVITTHFANIHRRCLQEGYDITCQHIPVVPAQHYLMGGIRVDMMSRTTMEHLYAAGETSCNGVHGRNRLASNSLLESMVFARRAARDIVECRRRRKEERVA